MPFKVEQKGQKYFVLSDATGAVKGTHDTKKDADAQMRTLDSNLSEVKDRIGTVSVSINE